MLLIKAHVVDLDVQHCDPGTEVAMTFDLSAAVGHSQVATTSPPVHVSVPFPTGERVTPGPHPSACHRRPLPAGNDVVAPRTRRGRVPTLVAGEAIPGRAAE